MKYQPHHVGLRVTRVTKDRDLRAPRFGALGTISHVERHQYESLRVLVDWDNFPYGHAGHAGQGSRRNKTSFWWISDKDLQPDLRFENLFP